jgi:hypothetical protein
VIVSERVENTPKVNQLKNKMSPTKQETRQVSSPPKVRSPDKFARFTPVKEDFSELRAYKDHLIDGLEKKVAANPPEWLPENRHWKDPFARNKPAFNPVRERYQKFCVDLNIYQADDTDLNMSPEGKRRRRLMEDFERTNQNVPGFGAKMVHDYAQQVQDERLWNQQRNNNRIKIFD